jgi:hypothetical protein
MKSFPEWLLARERALPQGSADPILEELRALEGIWKSVDGATACARIYNGELRLPYCFRENHLTGDYYNINLIHGALFARFRWFSNSDIWGYGYYRIVSPTQLSGGWWMGRDVPEIESDVWLQGKLPRAGMVAQTWTKQGDISALPDWAEYYYRTLMKAKRGN